jgi:peptidyl-prolyl cis-trans isomerase C
MSANHTELEDPRIRQWFTEPLLHFLAIGAVVFLLYSAVNDEQESSGSNQIIVKTADIERLSTTWSRKWNRSPTQTELAGLIEFHIREEVFYREALALGLDRNDAILRRRMMQKMEFLSNDIAELNQPDRAQLNGYFLANKDKFERPPQVSFTHIYFNLDKRGDSAYQEAISLLSRIQSAPADLLREGEPGDRFMLPHGYTLATPDEVSRLFGSRFVDQLFNTDVGNWQGPMESGYGIHLVRITEKIEARLPNLDTVIDQVRNEWMFEQRKRTNEDVYRKFKERYQIIVEKSPDQTDVADLTSLEEKNS